MLEVIHRSSTGLFFAAYATLMESEERMPRDRRRPKRNYPWQMRDVFSHSPRQRFRCLPVLGLTSNFMSRDAKRQRQPSVTSNSKSVPAPFFQLPIWFSISGGGVDLIKVVMRISHEAKTRRAIP
jgi:hypothetical protein